MDHIDFQAAPPSSLIIAPAQGKIQSGESVSFLYSLLQIEEILSAISLAKVPFSPSYVEGLSDWQDLVLPVISLERLLGLVQDPGSIQGNQAIVVKKTQESVEPDNCKRALDRIASGCRLITGVPKATPVFANDFIAEKSVPAIKGIYRWDKGLLIVPNMDHILTGEMNDVFIDPA
jgi:chemotaxis signal transduction protein